MMRKWIAVVLLLGIVAASTGCLAGPWTFREFVDDWSADVYADNTLSGTLIYVFVWPIGSALGIVVDAAFFNPVAWWGDDIWNGTGTTNEHTIAPKGRTNTKQARLMEQPVL